jgi:hypothetical protein
VVHDLTSCSTLGGIGMRDEIFIGVDGGLQRLSMSGRMNLCQDEGALCAWDPSMGCGDRASGRIREWNFARGFLDAPWNTEWRQKTSGFRDGS